MVGVRSFSELKQSVQSKRETNLIDLSTQSALISLTSVIKQYKGRKRNSKLIQFG